MLLAVTLAVGLLRGTLRDDGHPAGNASAARAHGAFEPPHRARRVYRVRAGDTLAVISSRTGVPQAKILALNPKISPTALFIGERLRLS